MQNLTSTVTPPSKSLSHPGEERQTLVFKDCDVRIDLDASLSPIAVSVTPHQPSDGDTFGHYPLNFYKLTDEQVVALLRSVVGRGKPVYTQQLWGAVHWFLKWACNFPPRTVDFCAKIQALPGIEELEYACVYDSVRKGSGYAFTKKHALRLNDIAVSRNEQDEFMDYRYVVNTMHVNLLKLLG